MTIQRKGDIGTENLHNFTFGYAIPSTGVEILRTATVLEIACAAFCASICFVAVWLALSYGIKMCQKVMKPQPTVQTIILIFMEEERRRTLFPGADEANRRLAQENDEPINLWTDQENFGEFVFLWYILPCSLSTAGSLLF